ncbi:hypothetical protein TcCL_NonESM04931 [Trypanosoma cruzi]|nr:hypothetical protein TcCL_NonESM04931 [Trypanosoma cruzi]
MDQPNVHGQLTLLLQECRDVAGRLAKFIGLAFHHAILQIPTLSVHRSHIVSLFLWCEARNSMASFSRFSCTNRASSRMLWNTFTYEAMQLASRVPSPTRRSEASVDAPKQQWFSTASPSSSPWPFTRIHFPCHFL